MVDLSAKPFNLDQDAISWVHATIDAMTLDEKIGQLFINHNNEFTPEYLDDILGKHHVGGMRYRSGDAAEAAIDLDEKAGDEQLSVETDDELAFDEDIVDKGAEA